jgi:hypothetical protein
LLGNGETCSRDYAVTNTRIPKAGIVKSKLMSVAGQHLADTQLLGKGLIAAELTHVYTTTDKYRITRTVEGSVLY